MRVLHVITRFTRGGAERNLAYTIGWELGQGFDVHLAVGRDHVPTELPSGAKRPISQPSSSSIAR